MTELILSKLAIVCPYTDMHRQNICLLNNIKEGLLLILNVEDPKLPSCIKSNWDEILSQITASASSRFYLRRLKDFKMIEIELETHYGFKLHKLDSLPPGCEGWHEHFMENQ